MLIDRSDNFNDRAHGSLLEFCKYLFAANTGAAAGLFLLTRSVERDPAYLLAFFLFCIGTALVGVAFMTMASRYDNIATGAALDFNALQANEISLMELNNRNRERWLSWKGRCTRYCLRASFVCLLIGGIITGYAFWFTPKPPHANQTAIQPIGK